MKLLPFVLIVVVATLLLFGGAIAIVLQEPELSAGEIALGVLPLTVFVSAPVYLASIVTYWDVRQSPTSTRHYRVYLRVVVGLELLAAASIVVFAAVTGAAWWLPVVFIGGGVGLIVLAVAVAPKLVRRAESRASAPAVYTPLERRAIVRKVWIIAATFVLTFVVVGILGAIFLSDEPAAVLQFSLQGASFVAALVCIVFSLSFTARVREVTGRDLARTSKIAKVVLRGKPIELDDDERIFAAKYAAIMPTFLAFQLGYIGLLYLGIGMQQVQMIGGPFGPGLAIPILVVFAAIVVAVFPLMIVRIRRASRYAREHAHLLTAAD